MSTLDEIAARDARWGETAAIRSILGPQEAEKDRRYLLGLVRDHIPEIDGHCDSGLYLGCSCGWTSDYGSNGWTAHLTEGSDRT